MDGIRGLNDWRWMFLFEGLPMIPLGIITWLFLNNIPDTVQCKNFRKYSNLVYFKNEGLDINEKELLTNLLRDDAGIANREIGRLSWRQVFYVFIDWRIYLCALIGIGSLSVIKYLTTSLPLIVKDIISTEAEVHLMTAPPFAFAFVCCLLVGYSSSRRNEHGFHLIFCFLIALFGFILLVTLNDRGKAALYVSNCIACSGVFSGFPLLLSWITNNIGGHTKRFIAIGFVIAAGQIGGVIWPLVRDC
jgi:hypothetical protein